jgi:acyl-CoA thioester hydrolase
MFTKIIIPRFGDVDGLGHINNTVLSIWFEKARDPVFRIFNPDLDLSSDKWNLIMVHTDFDFIAELYFGQDVEVRTYVLEIGNTSVTLLHEAWQSGELKVKGTSVMVYYDFVKKTTLTIPADIRKKLSEHIISEDHNVLSSS